MKLSKRERARRRVSDAQEGIFFGLGGPLGYFRISARPEGEVRSEGNQRVSVSTLHDTNIPDCYGEYIKRAWPGKPSPTSLLLIQVGGDLNLKQVH